MSKEDNKTRITNALAAVAAGALTNIFCDELLGGKFEGEIIDGSVWLVKVPYLNFWCRAGQVIGAFVISWLVIIFLISVFPEAIGRLSLKEPLWTGFANWRSSEWNTINSAAD